MSVFQPIEKPCPACATPVRFAFCDSVNGTRRPDLREEILQDRFQRVACEACGAAFRLDPAFTYLDVSRHQWLLVRPAGRLADWAGFENQARSIHDEAFGPGAGRSAREVGAQLNVRVTFGWPAVREKLLCAAHGLDDVTLELLKLGLLRWMGDPPLSDDIELRLTGADAATLQLAWLQSSDGQTVEAFEVARALFDDVAGDTATWATLRAGLAGASFVDMHRLLVAPD